MEVIVFVFVIGCFGLLMWHRGAFSADRQPAAVDPQAWPLDRYEQLPPDYCRSGTAGRRPAARTGGWVVAADLAPAVTA